MSLLLPDKHTPAEYSLLRQSERLYAAMATGAPVAQAWVLARNLVQDLSFGRFVLMLDVLYSLQLINFENGLLTKVAYASPS